MKDISDHGSEESDGGVVDDDDDYDDDDVDDSPSSYNCSACNREFPTWEFYDRHMSEHRVCGIDGCTFEANEKLVSMHVSMQHLTGLYNKICSSSSPEEISKWREERRKNYPTKENVELRYRKQEEMVKRGERIKERKRRFADKKTKFSKVTKTKKPKKVARAKPKSLIDERSDWNESMFPFKGTGQLYTATETETDFDDSEWSAENAQPARSNPILNLSNALGALMGAYCSDDSDADEQLSNSTTNSANVISTITESTVVGNTDNSSSTELSNNEIIRSDKLSETTFSTVQSNPQDDDEDVVEEKISREPIATTIPPITDLKVPERKMKKGKRHRKGKQQHNNKRQKLDKPSETPQFKKRAPTLLEKLLDKEIRHERNVLLQCVRFVVENNFFKQTTN